MSLSRQFGIVGDQTRHPAAKASKPAVVPQPAVQRVVQQSRPAHRPSQQVAQQAMPDDAKLIAMNVRIEFLERAVAELRELIARQAVGGAPAKKSRAEYYRDYRRRPK